MTGREEQLVELVDASGQAMGTATVFHAHQAPGRLHRAFSVFVRDDQGRVLLQQRAAVKTRFPLRWANTCCGHPGPGESLPTAATRRLGEELGLTVEALTEVGVYSYYAEDPATGLVEYEYDHVLLGDLPPGAELRPDPAEVADVRWVSVPDLIAELSAGERSHAPWLAGVTARLAAVFPVSPPVPRSRTAASAAASGVASVTASAASSAPDDSPERSGGR